MKTLLYRIVTALAACTVIPAAAQTVPSDLTLVDVATPAVSVPNGVVGVRHANDGSGRLFLIGRSGSIRIVRNGSLLATPFLTIPVSTISEQGLLGLAFHPQFASNGRFFVYHTRAAGGSNLGTTPDQLVAEYRVNPPSADVADAGSRIEILRLADLASNHNGGDIAFGPDGFLYVATGDGGPQNDPHGFAQCQWRKNADNNPAVCGGGTYALLGKILRIDIDATTTNPSQEFCGITPGATTANYTIPANNPNVGTATTCDEVYHWGMRNPYRMSFDRTTGDLWVADVGQGLWEEATLIPAGAGPQDLGWRTCEGRQLRGSSTPNSCTTGTLPQIDYFHDNGRCSITGGYRYRGPINALNGMYIYADFCSNDVFFARPNAGSPNGWERFVWQNAPAGLTSIVGFGEDQDGNAYVTTLSGAVRRFSSAQAGILFANGFE
jgi:glucose/arabinose dehydrogenase